MTEKKEKTWRMKTRKRYKTKHWNKNRIVKLLKKKTKNRNNSTNNWIKWNEGIIVIFSWDLWECPCSYSEPQPTSASPGGPLIPLGMSLFLEKTETYLCVCGHGGSSSDPDMAQFPCILAPQLNSKALLKPHDEVLSLLQ